MGTNSFVALYLSPLLGLFFYENNATHVKTTYKLLNYFLAILILINGTLKPKQNMQYCNDNP